jgi:hypothetical protein
LNIFVNAKLNTLKSNYFFKRFAGALALSFLPLLSFSQTDHWETAVYDNSIWTYTVPNASTPSNWIDPSFVPTSWSTGQGGFGFGDGDDNTAIPNGSISVYQRITFTVPSLSNITKAILNMDYDDGFVAYLNGVEIARNGLTGAGQPAYNQLASISHEAALYQGNQPDQFIFSNSQVNAVLVNGTNTLCIETHNQTATSTDFTSRAFLSFGIADNSVVFGPTPTWFNAPIELNTSNLPIVVLNTGGVTIPDEPKVDGVMGIIYNGPGVTNSIGDPFNEFYGQIAIERRGSSSNTFPMKSYGLETRGPDTNINYNVSVFDWPSDNDWILYAPYTDKAFIRNVLTYHIGNQMGSWAPRTQLCEVVLNGDYIGVYVFMERIKQNPGRVDIDELLYEDTTNNELTGGYILKVDKTTAGGVISWNSPYTSSAPGNGTIGFQMHDPESIDMHPTQLVYIEDYITAWEDALAGPNFSDPVTGFRPYVDVPSFIDFMLVNEVTKNVDGYRISSYLYKEKLSDGGKLFAGPLWDFNLGFGNANYCQGSDTTGWEINYNSICGGGWQNPFWWKRMLEDSLYAHDVNCRWQTLRQNVLSTPVLMNYIDSLATVLTEPAARNYTKWPILGVYVWPNNFVGDTFQEEIDYLKEWVTGRLTWMDNNMFGSCTDLGTNEVEKPMDISLFPNPANSAITIKSDNTIPNARIQIVTADGRTSSEVAINQLNTITMDISELESGIYFVRVLSNNEFYTTIKLIKK